MMKSTGQLRATLAGLGLALALGGVAIAQTAPATPALTQQTIRLVQEALGRQGIAVRTDGMLSEEMRAAVRRYQGQHHLPVTGELDAATLDKLGVRQTSSSSDANRTGDPSMANSDAASRTGGSAPMPGAGGPMMAMADCPMMRGQAATDTGRQAQMQAMMQMMQGMMQMMQSMHSMQSIVPTQPGSMQPGSMPPGSMPQRQDAR